MPCESESRSPTGFVMECVGLQKGPRFFWVCANTNGPLLLFFQIGAMFGNVCRAETTCKPTLGIAQFCCLSVFLGVGKVLGDCPFG